MQQKKNSLKVTFIEPMGAYANVFAKFMTIPMLGPLYLATIAEQAGYNVSILNENILGRKIKSFELKDIDILCISCMTTTIERGKTIAREYKKLRNSHNLKSRTIIGGIHASMIPDDVINDFDQVFVGEAETKILDILDGRIRDKIIYGEKTNLDSVPVPNFRLLKNWEKVKPWPIMTSRGCPFNCNFCSVTEMFGRSYRTKSIELVIDEIKSYDTNHLFFADDHFALNKSRTKKMLDLLKSNKINIKWSCQLRTEVSKDQDLVEQMRNTGCKTVYIGFESINPQSLKEMKKGQTVADIKRSIKVFKNNGINVHGMFMFGSDSDKNDIFRLTSTFCKKNALTSVQYLILTPLPGTLFYKKIEKEGRLLHKNWQFYDALHVVHKPRNFTPFELQQGMIDCFSDFYSYANAFNDAINTFFETFPALIKSLYIKVHFPSYFSSLIKFSGKRIVRNWIMHNKPYIDYLYRFALNNKIQGTTKPLEK
jgi:radical SAM superfamily enzyme YgiQ (UPF0313 family)